MRPTADPLAALDAIPATLIPAAIARLAARAMRPEPGPVADGALLTPADVATRLGVHRRWVYRHARDLGGVRLTDRKLRFPPAAVARYLTRRGGA